MTTTKVLAESLDALALSSTQINAEISEGELHQISLQLSRFDDQLREGIQLETADQIQQIIRKLEADENITAQELDLIRLWMLSDAEFYLQMENDFPNWVSELNRLFAKFQSLKGKTLSAQNMGELSGTARDALRVIADIEFFREQQQRIARFEKATKTLTTEDKGHLARLLWQKLRSPDQ